MITKNYLLIGFLLSFISLNVFASENSLDDDDIYLLDDPCAQDEVPMAFARQVADDEYLLTNHLRRLAPDWLTKSKLARKYTEQMAAEAALENLEPNFRPVMELIGDRFEKWLENKAINSVKKSEKALIAFSQALDDITNTAYMIAINSPRVSEVDSVSKTVSEAISCYWPTTSLFGSNQAVWENIYQYREYDPYLQDQSKLIYPTLVWQLYFNLVWEGTTEYFNFYLENDKDSIESAARITYRISERFAFIYFYEHLEEILNQNYEALGIDMILNKSELLAVIGELGLKTGPKAALLTPYTKVLERRIDDLSSIRFFKLWDPSHS